MDRELVDLAIRRRYREYMTEARKQERETRRDLYPARHRTFSIFIAPSTQMPRRDRNRPGPDPRR